MRIGEAIGIQELIREDEHPPEPALPVVPETQPVREPARAPGSRTGATALPAR